MMFADTSTDDLSPHCFGSRLDINHCRLSIRILERQHHFLVRDLLAVLPFPGSRGPCHRRFRMQVVFRNRLDALLSCLRVERSEFGGRKGRPTCGRKGAGGRRRLLRDRAPLLGGSVEALAQHRTRSPVERSPPSIAPNAAPRRRKRAADDPFVQFPGIHRFLGCTPARGVRN